MRLVISFLFCSFIICSCSEKTYSWKGEPVTHRKFTRKLKAYTKDFIKSNKEFVELMKDVEVVYDTTDIK